MTEFPKEKIAQPPDVPKLKLFRVEVEHVLYVLSLSASEAEREAKNRVDEVEPDSAISWVVRAASDIDPDWEHGFPYLADGVEIEKDLTCLELLDVLCPPGPYVDPNQQTLAFPQ